MSFSSIPPLTTKPPPTDPFEIFARRPSLEGTPNDLWGGQRDALQKWAGDRKKKDILISLNTGSGKTMLGVLIAQSLANEKDGKCVYACSTIDLVLQTEKEAKKLGLSPTTWYAGKFNNTDFEQGKTFCITTYASVFNSQAPFRKHNTTKFVFDDAHLAEKAIRDAFTLTIARDRFPELYAKVAQILTPAFVAAGYSVRFREIVEKRDSGILLAPPMLALELSDSLSHEIQKNLKGNLDLLFPFLYIGGTIKICAITISGTQIEIAPPFLPTSGTHPFSQDEMRRLYLSATLQTQSEFARAFGRRPDLTIAPETDAGNGERCILFGSAVPDEDTGPKLATAITEKYKLVIACRSYPDAKPWEELATIPKRDGFSEELETFRKASKGAFVLVARVDGIDLPDEACRVMLIDNLPSGYSQLERFQFEYCSMTSLAATKLASRITQVFGRINRGRKDFGVFILRGRSLNNWLNDAQNVALLPELLQKQLLLGDQVSQMMIKNKDASAILGVMDRVLARDPDWISTYGNRIAEAELPADAKAAAKEKDLLLTDAAVSEAIAMQMAWEGNFSDATSILAETADKVAIADVRLAGWHNLWLGWFYQLAGDAEAAGAEYARARSRLGSAVFLPKPQMSQIPTGRKLTLRGARIFELISEEHSGRFDKEIRQLMGRFDALSKPSASAAQHEEATRALGEALGFNATRPDNVNRKGPDVLWIDEERKEALLFELKSLQQPHKPITKTAVGQGHNHLQWVKDEHPDVSVIGHIFVADTETCNADANPSENMHIGPLSSLQELSAKFISEMRAMRSSLPMERFSKASVYAEQEENLLTGLMKHLAPTKLT